MSFGGGFQSQPRQQQQQDITSTLVQTVKQDVDLWEKGKQWAFSCYSPAKETACVPGIEDVSPEEMRLDAYQARISGKVDDFQRRYQELANDYAVKRRALINPNEAFKDVLRKIYNRESLVGLNPAALFQQSAGVVGVGGGGGIFGGNTTASGFQSSGSIFGGGQAAAAATSPSASSGIFGGKASGTSAFGTSVFGGGSSAGTSAPGSSIFGGGSAIAAATTGSSVFGGRPAGAGGIFSAQAQPQQQTQSLFGGQSAAPAAPGASVFGQPPSSSATSSSVFGGPPAFGSTSAFGSTPGHSAFGQQGSSIFGQAPQAQQRPQQPAALVQNTGPPQGSIFGQAGSSQPTSFSSLSTAGSPPQQQSVFGTQPAAAAAPSPFGAPTSSLQPGSGIFGSTSTTSPPAPNQSIFGAAVSTPQPTTASPSPFTPAASSTSASQAVSTGASVFGASNSAPGGSIFGAPIGQAGTVGLFGKVIKPQVDPSRYTPLEQLTPEELAEFTAEHFTLGKIPERPPPKEFCIAVN